MREIKCTNCLMQFKESDLVQYDKWNLLCPTCLDEYDEDDECWIDGYACENFCCSCCGCSCDWYDEEEPFEEEE